MTPGNQWVVLAFAIRLPFLENVIALPILSVLYVSPNSGRNTRPHFRSGKHRTPSELAKLMILMVSRWVDGRRFRVIGDACYATHELADLLNEKSCRCPNGSLVSRFTENARLHAEPGEYSGMGRPRVIGKRLPSPLQMSRQEDASWVSREVTWYGGSRRELMLLTGEGLWYRCSQGATWVRWVMVRDPSGSRKDEVFFTTDKTLDPPGIVECYARRWSIEVTFEEARRHLGIETLRNRTRNAIRRSAPMLLALFSLIVVWFVSCEDQLHPCSNSAPWYRKKYVTFSDMIKSARLELLRSELFPQDCQFTAGFLLAPFPLNIIYSLIAKKPRAA